VGRIADLFCAKSFVFSGDTAGSVAGGEILDPLGFTGKSKEMMHE
jgi:hypothetical protein